jgi:ABC-type Fe3+/spermidine/putrescine transport system ATPase subunit
LQARFEIHGFTALLGRSGAGKTSILKALAGLIPAAGTPYDNLAPKDRPIGYLPQAALLFPHLTVLENAGFALTGPDRLAVAQSLLNDLGIGHLSAQPATKISGGEAQRAALARALARRPELLLLDEPAAALDATTRDETMAALIAAITQAGIPALAATHDPAIAALADWIVLLSDQKIIQQGPAREVFANPLTAAAARLLGYQNIWSDNGIIYAIRTEDIHIAPSGRPATISAIRHLARHQQLTCAAPHRLTILAPITPAYEPGSIIHLHFPPHALKTLQS